MNKSLCKQQNGASRSGIASLCCCYYLMIYADFLRAARLTAPASRKRRARSNIIRRLATRARRIASNETSLAALLCMRFVLMRIRVACNRALAAMIGRPAAACLLAIRSCRSARTRNKANRLLCIRTRLKSARRPATPNCGKAAICSLLWSFAYPYDPSSKLSVNRRSHL